MRSLEAIEAITKVEVDYFDGGFQFVEGMEYSLFEGPGLPGPAHKFPFPVLLSFKFKLNS